MPEREKFEMKNKGLSFLRYVVPVVLLLIAFFAGWMTARWQTRLFPGPPFSDFRRLSNRLDLSAEQKAQLEPIIKKQRDEMLEIRRQCRERVMSGRDGVKAQIESILTSEQIDEFRRTENEFRQKHRPGRQRWRE
ncbi:MAG: hypothetical protein PHC51_06965 [bacterium]|nr:hypothetical protein [bacterium]